MKGVLNLVRWLGCTHGLRNEVSICVIRLHKLMQCSRFFLAQDQKYSSFMKTGQP